MDNKQLARPLSMLETALNVHGEELQNLSMTLNSLSNRLTVVRSPRNTDASGPEERTQAISSPVVDQIKTQTDLVLRMQEQINGILTDLEV